MSKTVEKNIYELFEPENGNSKYTKSYCSEHSGPYIVYTGTTIGVFGKVDVADFSTPNLTFTTDGEKAGTLEYITDEGYCIGGHRTILKPLSTQLDLLYFKFILQPLFYTNVKRGDVPSLHFNRIKNKKVQVPINDKGEFDLERQKELAKKYQDVEQKKKQLLGKAEEIKKVKLLISRENGISYKKIPINAMFKHNNGKSIYTKEYCRAHSGFFPVFSCPLARKYGVRTQGKFRFPSKFYTDYNVFFGERFPRNRQIFALALFFFLRGEDKARPCFPPLLFPFLLL